MTPLAMRLRSPSLPADLVTGDARIDAHLMALDAALAGFAAVRRQTLLEARDFLLEAREHALAAGHDDATATQEAIALLGPIEAIASEQRAGRVALFRRTAAVVGLLSASLMLLLSLLQTGWAEANWVALAGTFAFFLGFSGITMGYLAAYVLARAQPAPQDAPAPGSFLVHYARSSIRLAWGLFTVFGLTAAIVAAGMAGIGPTASWPPALAVVMLLLVLRPAVGGLRAARFQARVDAESLQIDGLFGRVRIPRAALTSIARARLPLQVLIPAPGLSYGIEWRDEGGRTRRTFVAIPGELVQGDRLLAWLEAAARANAGEHAGGGAALREPTQAPGRPHAAP